MDININHARDPLAGWDIDVAIKAEKTEVIARVRIEINGSNEADETVQPPARKWHKQLTQRGQYPGDNSVSVTATDGDGEDTTADDEWSS